MSKSIQSFVFAVTGTFLLVAILLSVNVFTAHGSAPSGLRAIVATTSNPTVTSTAGLVFATSTQCSARVITTYASPIMVTFSDVQGKVPTGTFGHLQAASTTVAYDSGIYGCETVRIYSFTSQAITVTETQ